MEGSTFLNPTQTLQLAKLSEGMRVADFGAGSGFFTRAAAREVGEHAQVWAVDVSRDLLPRIKKLAEAEGLHNVEVVHGDVSQSNGSNLPEKSIDFCIAANLLFQTEHKKEVVEEIKRVLVPSGKALVIDWSSSHGGLGPHTDHVLTKADAEKLFEEGGFTIVGDIPAGEYHWGFLARKNKQ